MAVYGRMRRCRWAGLIHCDGHQGGSEWGGPSHVHVRKPCATNPQYAFIVACLLAFHGDRRITKN